MATFDGGIELFGESKEHDRATLRGLLRRIDEQAERGSLLYGKVLALERSFALDPQKITNSNLELMAEQLRESERIRGIAQENANVALAGEQRALAAVDANEKLLNDWMVERRYHHPASDRIDLKDALGYLDLLIHDLSENRARETDAIAKDRDEWKLRYGALAARCAPGARHPAIDAMLKDKGEELRARDEKIQELHVQLARLSNKNKLMQEVVSANSEAAELLSKVRGVLRDPAD